MTCRHCADPVDPWKCPHCKRKIRDECRECHMELCAGEIGPPPVGRPGLGDVVTQKDIAFHGDGHYNS